MNGVLIIDKPEEFTSHDIVARLRRILNKKKIGHTGTLDPVATGVLVMLVGKATRLARFLDKDAKTYEALLRFGFETDTGDRTGERRQDSGGGNRKPVSADELENALPEFIGEIKQIPPMYSAKKVKGKKLYDLARKGVEIERQPVNVTISELELVKPGARDNQEIKQPKSTEDTLCAAPDSQHFKIKVTCSAGTYIRTLAEDIGRRIGVGCHLAALRRIRAGRFDSSRAVSLEKLEEKVLANELDTVLISMNETVSHLPLRQLDTDELKRVENGMKIDASFDNEGVLSVRLTDESKNLIAIGTYNKNEEKIQPRIVL